MKDTYGDPIDQNQSIELDAKYEAAMHSLALQKQKRIQQGYASASVASAMAGGYRDKGAMPKAAVIARGFLILFAMLLPSLLLLRVVF